MNLSATSAHAAIANRSSRRVISLLVFSLIQLFLNLVALPVQAQQVDRILILYSNWRDEAWSRDFDLAFDESIREVAGDQVEISHVHLGLNTPLPSGSRERLKRNVESTISEQGVDLIVAAQYDAIQFYAELTDVEHLPAVLVLPGDSAVAGNANPDRIRVVNSAWREALETTVQQIMAIRPETNTVEVISGNGEFDLFYLDGFQDIASDYSDRFEFNYLVGADPDTVASHVSQLPQDSVLMMLTTEAYGPDRQPLLSALLPTFVAESSVPVFGMYDSALEFGIVGGHLTSVEAYAEMAVLQTAALLGIATERSAELSGARTVYNWEQLDRWGLSVDNLAGEVEVINVPASFIEENILLTVVVVNAFLLLAAGLVIQSIMLKRSHANEERILLSEKQARESEEKYKLLATNVADVIWTWEEGMDHMTYCSPSVTKLTGFSAEEFQQMPLQDIMPKDSLENAFRILQTESNAPQVIEFQAYAKDGRTVDAEMVVQRNVRKKDGRIEWTGVTRDVSQRKQNERDRQALEDQRKQAQKLESLGTLAGGIAHDFNNILGVILGVADILKREEFKSEKSGQLLNQLTNASEKAQALVQQILTFSRESRGSRTVFSFNEVLESCTELIQAGNSNNLSLEVNNSALEAELCADKSQIEQVIINIVTNAIEACENGPAQISVNVNEKLLSEAHDYPYGTVGPGNYLSLSVSDNGIGMNAESLARLFDPFYTSKELGHGLGLAIVHGIVIEHDGAIDVISTVDSGTTIEVLLPLSDASSKIAPQNERKLDGESPPKRIMVIDDNENLLEVCAEMLTSLGHDCITCAEPGKAKSLIDSKIQEIDLIITDYSMPDVTGLDIIAYCAKHYPSIPVILSTGFGEEITRREGSDLGTTRILNKPFNLSTLQQTLALYPNREPAAEAEAV